MKEKENRLVVGDRSWADTIPEWVLKEVEAERTVVAAINLTKKGKLSEEEQVGDAEVVAYLYPASMAHPLDRNYFDIYIYLCLKLTTKTKKTTREALPKDFVELLDRGLSGYQKGLLRELRRKIFKARGGVVSHSVFDALAEVFKDHKNKKSKDKKRRASSLHHVHQNN